MYSVADAFNRSKNHMMQVFFHVLAQLAVLLAAALIFRKAALAVGWPAVCGELLSGVLLGPTLLGAIGPDVQSALFPAQGQAAALRDAVLHGALLVFLFSAGLEIDLVHLETRGTKALWTSLLGIVVPFSLGCLLVQLQPQFWTAHFYGPPWMAPLFLGTALSITALPVIARVLKDLQLLQSGFGAVVMTAATIDDLIGWSLFSVLLNHFAAGSGGVFFPKMALFGVFLAGVILARPTHAWRAQYRSLMRWIMDFFVPLYFVSIGLRADFAAHFDVSLAAVVLAVAFLGKITGASLGARLGKAPWNEALAVGFAMNARGAMEMVLASLAFHHRLIDEPFFVALIFMALITSLVSGPVIKKLIRV